MPVIPVFVASENPVFRQILAERERFELSERSTAHTISRWKKREFWAYIHLHLYVHKSLKRPVFRHLHIREQMFTVNLFKMVLIGWALKNPCIFSRNLLDFSEILTNCAIYFL